MKTGDETNLTDAVKQWANETNGLLKLRISNFSRGKTRAKINEKKLKDSLFKKVYVEYRSGLPQRIAWGFAKHGVFREKGVGKGRGIKSGKTNPAPWFNPTMQVQVEKLADIVNDKFAELTVKKIFI